VLAGDGSIAATLQNLAGGLRLGDRFKLLGHCDDMRPFYGALDLFVLASLWEGMPYVVLEAMAAGLPVCATDLPGMRQIVMENETGSLVPPEDDEALARRIVELLRDEAKRLRFRERARHIVRQRFTAQRFLRQLESLYLGDLARQSPRSVIRRMS
jgi:starch synthase (maltosyl-transferring)